jgi:hypothetical protein
MSFICQNPKCKKTQRAGVRPEFIVIETRPKTYTKKITSQETGEVREVIEGQGFETVKEIAVCTPCAERHFFTMHDATPPTNAPLAALVSPIKAEMIGGSL